MKKRVLALLVLLVCLLAFGTVSVSATETEHADHCVCGGHAEGMENHSCETVTWTAWGTTDEEKTSLPTKAGSYYLVADITVSAVHKIASGSEVDLCLNGHSINTSDRMINVYGTLGLTDCSAAADWGTVCSTENASNGGIFYTYAGSTTNLYAGNLDASQAKVRQGGVAVVQGVGTTFNIYRSNLTGATLKVDGSNANRGGILYSISSSTINIYGGTLTGGTVSNDVEKSGGGSICVGSGTTLNMKGGSIGRGASVRQGGCVYAIGTFNMSGGSITGGTVSGGAEQAHGGCVYVEGKFNMSGGSVANGSCDGSGQDVYVKTSGQLTVGGGAQIGQVYLPSGVAFTTDQMTGRVGLSAEVPGDVLTVTATEEEAACFVSAMEGYYVAATEADGAYALSLKYHADHCVCGAHAEGMENHSCETVTWTAWGTTDAEKTSLPTKAGSYYLVADIALTSTQEMTESIDLCLNGFSVTSSKRTFNVKGMTSITDCSAQNQWGAIRSGNSLRSTGGICYVYTDAELNIYGGIFDASGTAIYQGGVAVVQGGTANVYAGQIIGAELVQNSSGASDTRGGVFYLIGGATCNIYGGSVSGGHSLKDGGSIYVGNGTTLYVKGGTVSQGKADGNGGNIYVATSTANANQSYLYMSGGTVTAGQAAGSGDNIYAAAATDKGSQSHMEITGGIVSNGAVYTVESDQLTVGGDAQIGDLYIPTDVTFYTTELTGSVGLTVETKGQVVTTAATAQQAQSFTSNEEGYSAKYNAEFGVLVDDHAAHCVCGAHAEGMTGHSCQEEIWMPWGYQTAETTSLPGESGNYYLVSNITLDGTRNMAVGTDIRLCLNGYNIATSEENTARIWNVRDRFSLTDCGEKTQWGTVTSGAKTTNGGIMFVYDNAIVNIYAGNLDASGTGVARGGIAIVGNGAAATMNIYGGNLTGGTLTLENATSSNTRGGTLYIIAGSCVNVYGGNLSGGSSLNDGGSVYIYSGALRMSGGSITGAHADTNGGNIYCNDTLEITGGSITSGTSGNNGGNLYCAAGAQATVSNAVFKGGEAVRAGSIAAFGQVTISNTLIDGGTATNGGGGNIMAYTDGQLTLNSGTVLKNGVCSTNGAAISCTAGTQYTQHIGDGVTIYSGSAGKGTNGIYLAAGVLTVEGDPLIEELYVDNSSTSCSLNTSKLSCTAPILLSASEMGAFADSTVNSGGSFTSASPICRIYYDAENQQVCLVYRELEYVYVDAANGDDNSLGTADAPVQTMERAMNAVQNGGTIHLVGTVELSDWDAHEKAFTITGGELLLPETRVYLHDHVTFDALTVTIPMCSDSTSGNFGSYFFYCDGFTTVIEEDVTIRYLFDGQYMTDPYHTVYQTKDDGTTEELNATSNLYGGCNSTFGTVSGTNLTVMSGVWGNIYGGNNAVDLTGDIHLTVGGKVNEGVDYVSHTHSGWHIIMGGSRKANIDGTIYMNVTGGNYHTSTHGGSQGDSDTTYSIGAIELHASGGNGMAIYGGGRGGDLNIGTINFYYEGATFEQVFGGSLSQCLTGDVNLIVTGGKITRRLYGGCYTNREESVLGSWDPINLVTGNVDLIIGSGANITCDLKNPDGEDYFDRGIYGHSRQPDADASDGEHSRIIFLDEAAYNKHKGNLKAQDDAMKVLMLGVTAADYVCYLGWSADDANDVITSGAIQVEDHTDGALALPGQTATLVLSGTSFDYTGEPITPGSVTYSDNWTMGQADITYTGNIEAGTATAIMTVDSYSVSKSFTINPVEIPADVAQVITAAGAAVYNDLQEAVDAAGKGGYLKLLRTTDESVTVSTDLYLDLNGCSLTGKVTVVEGAILYGMDSTTDDYDCSDGYGIIAELEGSYAPFHKTNITGRILRYLAVKEDAGISFHRFYLGIRSMNLKPSVTGVGYKALFGGDEKVVAMLGAEDAYGYDLWLGESGSKVTRSAGKDSFVSGNAVTLRLQNFDVDNYGTVRVNAQVYIKLTDGTVITSATYSYTLQEMVEAVNENIGAYDAAQVQAIKAMCEIYKDTAMATWDIKQILDYPTE